MIVGPGAQADGSRWRLYRGGIVNIWEYGERTLDLAGGRVILQGTNGSGKSRTLELLLPLCLDGDLHHLGAKGYDTVSIRRLMLDDYAEGPNRIGYAWIELRREVPDGGAEFLTAGIGVKASKTTQGVASSWRFVTGARVGIDFNLAGTDKTPLDQKGLKERIGADAVFDEDPKAMQQRIATVVYGIGDLHRYDDLLHLQRTLRNPDVGVKAVEGQLEEYLGRALPPLDPDVVKRLANQFQDLEAIRENIGRLREADRALSEFLRVYAAYAAGALRDRANAVVQAQGALTGYLRVVEARVREVSQQCRVRDKAALDGAAHERLERELNAQVRELDGTQEYRDLNVRRQLVDALKQVAESALRNATNCRNAENTAARAVLSVLLSAKRAAEGTVQAAKDACERFGRAGLDPRLLPAPPAPPAAELTRSTGYVQINVGPEAAPGAVERVAPPPVDFDALTTTVQQVAAETQRAIHAANERHTLAATLQRTASQLEQDHQQITKLKAHAEEAAAAADQTATDHRIAVENATATAQDWLDAARRWAEVAPASAVDLGEQPSLPGKDDLVDDPGGAAESRTAHRAWAAPAVAHARDAARAAGLDLRTMAEERERVADELHARRLGVHAPPPPFRYASADRKERPGAAFYQLVDFHPHVTEQQRAGLEAALQASGLLDAWVAADGTIADPDLHDVLAVTETAPPNAGPSPTLASMLVPAPDDGCSVAADAVARLLVGVRIADNPAEAGDGGLAVSLTGRWRAGSLAGAWTKDIAEHIGASTRQAYRQRRITELLALLKDLDGRLTNQQQRSRDAEVHLATWEKHVENFPDTAPVVAAHATAIAVAEHREAAELQAQAKIQVHAQAQGLWQAKHSELSRQAAEVNLPDAAAALGQRLTQITSAIEAAGALSANLNDLYLPAIHDAAAPMQTYTATLADREEAEDQAATSHGDYAQAAKAMALYLDSLGIDGEEYDRRLSQLRQRLERTRTALPRLRAERDKAVKAVIELEAAQKADEPNEQQKRDELAQSERRFAAAAGALGVWAAASDGDEQPPVDRQSALQTAAGWHSDLQQADLINALQTFREHLPDGHDATVRNEDDVFTVLVSDGEGARPIAAAAGRTAHRLAEHKEQLDTRYREILEEYLLRDLAEHLRRQIDAADDLCGRMNAILADARSSQGVHVQLSWDPSPALDDATREALALVRKSFATRSPEQDAQLRRALQERIEAERDLRDARYSQVLTQALDYRTWYAFTVRVRDIGPDGQSRNRLLRRLSSGETRLISYVTLFAAAAAFYDALTVPGTNPLRLVLLDEAFERLDDPTTTRLLELLADLDMDWIITWPGGSAFSPKIDRMQVYDIFRPKGAPGIAFVHTTWDGIELRRSS
ncbi:TIGR02680 family protein [Micromonospora sp. CPCC 205558]|uniref:TIGR02680 family protein n=1 Tax=Micromonospora sp. CPCC 205558 TaxID=3122403 RepID=UPI002FF2AF9F